MWYHAENEDPWKIPIVREIRNKHWTFIGKNQFYVNTHIQDIPENLAQIPSSKSIHRSGDFSASDLSFTRCLMNLTSHDFRGM